MKRLTKREKMDAAFDEQTGDMKAAEAQGMFLAEYHAKPLTEIIGDGLDAAVDGRGFGVEHQKAFDLANAAPAMLKAINEADVAFACINMCDDLTPQARGALVRAWSLVQAAIVQIRPNSVEAEAIKMPGSAYSIRQLLEEYMERRNDSKYDPLWDEFDSKVREALG